MSFDLGFTVVTVATAADALSRFRWWETVMARPARSERATQWRNQDRDRLVLDCREDGEDQRRAKRAGWKAPPASAHVEPLVDASRPLRRIEQPPFRCHHTLIDSLAHTASIRVDGGASTRAGFYFSLSSRLSVI